MLNTQRAENPRERERERERERVCGEQRGRPSTSDGDNDLARPPSSGSTFHGPEASAEIRHEVGERIACERSAGALKRDGSVRGERERALGGRVRDRRRVRGSRGHHGKCFVHAVSCTRPRGVGGVKGKFGSARARFPRKFVEFAFMW